MIEEVTRDVVHIKGFNHETLSLKTSTLFSECFQTRDITPMVSMVKPSMEGASPSSLADIRMNFDLVFKHKLNSLLEEERNQSDPEGRMPQNNLGPYENLLNMSIEGSKNGINTVNLPVTLLTDMFDTKTLNECEGLFVLVEDRIPIWKSDHFYSTIKNPMLRTCNDLLKRLSKSQNTVFCGKILVFLARLFPLFERSGLNLVGEFNKNNVISLLTDSPEVLPPEPKSTPIKTEPVEEGEVEDGEKKESSDLSAQSSFVVNYDLYLKFWSLQDFFRNPIVCYEKPQWRKFTSYSNDVLKALSLIKIDTIGSGKSVTSSGHNDPQGSGVYFAKYLTSQKLLDLQLGDSTFRRYVLIQFLITTQYLTSPAKNKGSQHVLTDEQNEVVSRMEEQIYELISGTLPNGYEMREIIRTVLEREKFWSTWKNDGCPEMSTFDVYRKIDESNIGSTSLKRKRWLLEYEDSPDKINMGNPELTRLWNLCPDNWKACQSQERVFTPAISDYFYDVMRQNKEKRQRTLSGDRSFAWKALRMLRTRSNNFITSSGQQIKPISGYLDTAIDNLAKELRVEIEPEPTLGLDDAEDILSDDDDDFLKPENATQNGESRSTSPANGPKKEDKLTKEMVENVSGKIQRVWKRIAPSLTFTLDEIEFWEAEAAGDQRKAATMMLNCWIENFEDESTIPSLQIALDKSNVNIKM